jgi:hypothetical protein
MGVEDLPAAHIGGSVSVLLIFAVTHRDAVDRHGLRSASDRSSVSDPLELAGGRWLRCLSISTAAARRRHHA